MPVEHCALSCKVQATLGKPGHGQRIDQVFLGMNPLRQAGWRVIRLYRYYCLYDQWATVEFLGDEVHAAAMLAITGLTHREAYRDIFVITVVIPVIATLLTIGLSALIA